MKNVETNPIQDNILIIDDLDDQEPRVDFFEVVANLCVKQTKENYGIDLTNESKELIDYCDTEIYSDKDMCS